MTSPRNTNTPKKTHRFVEVTFDIGGENLQGHNLPSTSDMEIVDSSLLSTIESISHNGNHPLVRAYNKANGFEDMHHGDSEIPDFKGIELADKELVLHVINQKAWPKTRLAMENLLKHAK